MITTEAKQIKYKRNRGLSKHIELIVFEDFAKIYKEDIRPGWRTVVYDKSVLFTGCKEIIISREYNK